MVGDATRESDLCDKKPCQVGKSRIKMCCLAERPSSSELNNSGLWEPMQAAEITRYSAEAQRNRGPESPKIPHSSLQVGGVILAPSSLMITGQTKIKSRAKFRETAVPAA